jgi:alpha-beta hydrolase superfamily lysophospholipase
MSRGTVVLFPGRGEHPGVYERLVQRLAVDGYTVRFDLDDSPEPVVLAGSDTGALRALALAATAPVAGVIAAGTPWTAPAPALLGGGAERGGRSAGPPPRARLEADPGFARGALTDPVPAELLAAVDPAAITVPVLLIHGEADPVVPLAAVRDLAGRLSRAELATVRDGRHDALNDSTHRTVAAHVVQWLERLRSDPKATPILTVS